MSLHEEARILLESRRFGVLATQSVKIPGHPFASVVTYALEPSGDPIFLLSRLAVHTKNLLADPHASFLVFDERTEAEPLDSARVTLIGEIQPVEGADLSVARVLYIARQPAAEQWIDFGDFALYRMAVASRYFVGGFGRMGWL